MAFGIAHSYFGSPTITLEKFNDKNYLSWFASVELRFLSRCYHHLEEDDSKISL